MTEEQRSRMNAKNGRKGRSKSPWGAWQPAVARYPELNTSTKLREPCTYRRPK
jgi:hypothetical protein